MQIGNFIIHRASTIRKRLEKYHNQFNDKVYARTMQTYMCRIFGICIYRNESCYYNLTKKLQHDTLKKIAKRAYTPPKINN